MTNPAARELRPTLLGLQGWVPTIKRSVYADTVTFEMTDNGILATVKWNFKGEAGQWTRLFTTAELLGNAPNARPSEWMGNRRACTYARQVIAGVLAQRGV